MGHKGEKGTTFLQLISLGSSAFSMMVEKVVLRNSKLNQQLEGPQQHSLHFETGRMIL